MDENSEGNRVDIHSLISAVDRRDAGKLEEAVKNYERQIICMIRNASTCNPPQLVKVKALYLVASIAQIVELERLGPEISKAFYDEASRFACELIAEAEAKIGDKRTVGPELTTAIAVIQAGLDVLGAVGIAGDGKPKDVPDAVEVAGGSKPKVASAVELLTSYSREYRMAPGGWLSKPKRERVGNPEKAWCFVRRHCVNGGDPVEKHDLDAQEMACKSAEASLPLVLARSAKLGLLTPGGAGETAFKSGRGGFARIPTKADWKALGQRLRLLRK